MALNNLQWLICYKTKINETLIVCHVFCPFIVIFDLTGKQISISLQYHRFLNSH